jgi:hypothetical protein
MRINRLFFKQKKKKQFTLYNNAIKLQIYPINFFK